MSDYRNADGTTTRVERKSNVGAILAAIVVLALIIVGVLFATGFWSANVSGGKLPQVNVSTKDGAMPNVDVHTKKVVVGTRKEVVEVPTVGVKDGK